MVSIPKNPFTPERQEQLKENAVEFLETFSKEYLKAFGFSLLESIMNEDGQDDARKLKYRKWDSIERPELYTGRVYFKSGNGPGTWSKWQEAYLAETQEYNIEVYKTEKDFKAKKKPKNVISPVGYSIIKYVSQHYKDVLADIGPDMGMTDEEVASLASLSQYAWAMSHPLRTNYVFQLHKSSDPGGCLCIGGKAVVEPEDLGREEAKDRDQYIEFLQRCSNKCQVRDVETIKGKAFDRTVRAMVEKMDNLSYFKDDGTEPEIMTHMLVKQCLSPLRGPMLEDLAAAPAGMKLTLWMKARGMVQGAMVKLVTPAWDKMSQATDEMLDKIEPTIRQGIDAVKKAKEEIKNKVRAAVVDKVGEALKTYVSPYLKDMMKSFEKPINDAFEQQKKILNDVVPDPDKMNSDEKMRNLQLDSIPRSYKVTKDMQRATGDIIEALEKVKEMHEIFNYIEPEAYRQQAEDALLKVLDAAVFTLEQRVSAEGKKNEIKAEVMKDWESDVQLMKGRFISMAIKAIIIGGVKKALSPAVDPVLDPIDEAIPEDMQEFLSARGLYDEIADLLIGEPIEKMVDGAYPPPK